MEIKNFTGTLDAAEAFIRAKAEHFDTDGLSVHIKYTRAKGRDLNGYYRLDDSRIVVAVKRRLRYPRQAAYGVGSQPVRSPRAGKRPYRLVWHEETFRSPDDLLVFAAGHEVWHYVCHSGQRKGDFETKANCAGFAWLTEFRRWAGAGTAVEAIPTLPPRPDLPQPTTRPSPVAPRPNLTAFLLPGLAPDRTPEFRSRPAGRARRRPQTSRTHQHEGAEQLSLFDFAAPDG